MSDLYAVVRESSLGIEGVEVYDFLETAVSVAGDANDEAEKANAPVVYRVYGMRALEETELWDWGHRLHDGRVLEYVNEWSARVRVPGGNELVRRRKGSEIWEVAQ